MKLLAISVGRPQKVGGDPKAILIGTAKSHLFSALEKVAEFRSAGWRSALGSGMIFPMKLLATSLGLPKSVSWNGKEVLTGIWKAPVTGPVRVGRENLEGDRQADLKVHGGVDKAVYAYSFDTYEDWKRILGTDELPYGALGENLTIDLLDEAEICVGDRFELGSCVLEAVQPRMPCFKLGIRYGDPGVVKKFNEYGRPGIYFRVLKEGVIQAGDEMKPAGSEETVRCPISELFRFALDKSSISPERARELVRIRAMNASWAAKFTALGRS